MLVERLKNLRPKRPAPLPVALLARLRPSLRMNTLDAGDGVRLVEVTPFEGERFFWAHTCADEEHRQRGVGGVQLVGDCVDKVRELAAEYQLREVMFDPWRFGQAAQELERERIVVTQFPQTDARMVPASDRLYQAVVGKRLVLPDHDEMRAHMANTIAKHSRRGWRLDKPSLDQPNDSIIALAMALEALENQPQPVEVLGWL